MECLARHRCKIKFINDNISIRIAVAHDVRGRVTTAVIRLSSAVAIITQVQAANLL